MNYIFDALLLLILAIISYKDYKEHAIYDFDITICLLLIFLKSFYNGILTDTLYGCITGALIGLLCYCLGFLISKSESFGIGDILILSVIGGYLGDILQVINYFWFSCFFNVFMLLPKIIYFKKYRNTEYPAAPLYLLGLICFLLMNKPDIFLLLKPY